MFLKISLYCLFVLIMAVSCQSTKNGPEYILRLGHQANEMDIWHRAAVYFSEMADSLSEGRIEVRVYPFEQLGRELDMIRSIRAGIVDMTITGESMQNWADMTAFCAIPYLIRDSDHLKKVVNGPLGNEIAAEMINKIGLRPVGYFERGPRHLTSNRPVRTPEDLKGIILRVPNVPLFIGVWQSLGAKPTPMTFSEVFTALQQGTVEAQENPFALIYSAGFYEVQKYLNLTMHVNSWIYLVIGEKQFRSMPEELQHAITVAGKLTQEFHHREFENQEQVLRRNLEEKGMIFIDTDIDAFREQSEKAVMEILPEAMKEMYHKIVNVK